MYRKRFLSCLVLTMTLPIAGMAQSGTDTDADKREVGGYEVHQSIEFGYRFADVNGSQPVYDTFIDQHEGPRLLGTTLSLRSPEHAGALFDDLSLSSSGWGGDPENVGRLRISKFRLYDFTASFRRDRNYFDYNLLRNPLNPPGVNLGITVNTSPGAMYTTRRMYDFGLTVLPDSKVSFRLGYSRNRSEGPAFSSFHEGTDVLLNQLWNVTSNDFRFGIDYRIAKATTISYDQFLTYGKNDTDNTLAPFAVFPLSTGTLVSLGLPWNTPAGQPCATPFVGGFVNPACNGYFSYTRTQRVRTTTPTEQLSLKSNMGRLNVVARFSYSSTDLDSPFSEFFDGFVTRTRERQFTFSGPAAVRQITTTADLGITYELTHGLSLSDTFRFDNMRVPGTWDSLGTATAGTSLTSPLGAVTTTPDFVANFFSHKSYANTLELEFRPSKHLGAHVGYRFRRRDFFKAEPEHIDPEAPFEPFEGDSIEINEHGAIGGVWIRPIDPLRVNFDVEATSADNFITRVSPRQRQNYRARATYTARSWATISATANIWESRNGEADTQARQHYRNDGFSMMLLPKERFNLDLSYNYSNALQDALICFNGAFLPPGAIANGCPTFDASANPNPNQIFSTYHNTTHYVSGSILFKPMKRVTANLGYSVTKTDGTTTLLSPFIPLGPLEFTYHQPLASLSYEFIKNWSLNAYWNYDQYNEGGGIGPTLPRYFHDNRTVLSMKYAF